MADFIIRPIDIFDIIKRQRFVIGISFLLTLGGISGLKFVLPKTFQAEVFFHIGDGYFHDPLINGLVSQSSDPGELRSEREKIIQASLGPEFLNRVGEKLKLFTTSPADPGRAVDLAWMGRSLEVSPVTATQFRLTYKSGNPQIANEIVKEALLAIRERMFQSRIATLQQLDSVLGTEISHVENGDRAAGAPEVSDIQRRIEELRHTYSEQHPIITALKSRLEELKATKSRGALGVNLAKQGVLGKNEAAPPTTIRDDLNRQKHLVNIALEMERQDPQMTNSLTVMKEPEIPRSPIFPKLRMFLLFGLVAGVLVSTLLAALREFYQREEMQSEVFAKKIGAPVFGTIFIYPEKLDPK